MNPKFLRDEAARFRGMAEEAERDATKLRLLAMAADYERRASVADEMAEPMPAEAVDEPTESKSEETIPEEAIKMPVEPDQGETLKLRPGRRIAKELKETVLISRRPVNRQR